MINRAGNFFLLLNSLLTIHRFIASRLANIDILKNCANKSAVDFVQKAVLRKNASTIAA